MYVNVLIEMCRGQTSGHQDLITDLLAREAELYSFEKKTFLNSLGTVWKLFGWGGG